jgi:hypothetical protein
MSSPAKREPGAVQPGGGETGSGPVPAGDPPPAGAVVSEGRPAPAPDTAIDAALGRFGTDRLGDGQLETDRLLAIAHRHRSPEVRLQAALRAEAGRLLANWIVRIANLPVYRARPDLRLDQLMDGLPGVVHAVLQAIATPDPGVEPEPGSRAAEVAAAHARRRAQVGFPVGAVLAELRELHAEVLAQLWRLVDEQAPVADESVTPRALIDRLAIAVGELQIAAAEAWVAVALPSGDAADGEPPSGDDPSGRREGQH